MLHQAVDRICAGMMLKVMDGPSFSLGFSQEVMSQPESQSEEENLYDTQTGAYYVDLSSPKDDF